MSTTYTVIGTPFSTFTRTITLALSHKGIKFNQISTLPLSDLAFKHHPFGFLPTLVIKTVDENGVESETNLRESQAIARYIDSISPEPSLDIDTQKGPLASAKMWEFASFAAAVGYNVIEWGIVKPRLSPMWEGKLSEQELSEITKPGIPKAQNFLQIMEPLMAKQGYAFDETVTWADFFLFPILADLRPLPEWQFLKTERLDQWLKKMDDLEAVKATAAGTLSVGDKPF